MRIPQILTNASGSIMPFLEAMEGPVGASFEQCFDMYWLLENRIPLNGL